MQRVGFASSGGKRSVTRKVRRGGGNDPTCGCDMQAGWPKFLTENIPLPSFGPSQPTGQKGGASCGIPPIPNYYQGGGGCAACAGLPLPTPMQQGGGQPTVYNSNPVPDACPFPGTGYCEFYARGGGYGLLPQQGGANYGEPMYLQARLRGGKQRGGANLSHLPIVESPENSEIRRRLRELRENRPRYSNTVIIDNNNNNNNNPTNPIQNMKNNEVGDPTQVGGGCGCGLARMGGSLPATGLRGGYRPTKKNLNALKRWKRGESIGFTMTSSLKAKGLIPRTSRKHRGKKVVSAKYK